MDYSKEDIQQLLDYFWELTNFCNELDIYEHGEMDDELQEMKEVVKSKFGRKII